MTLYLYETSADLAPLDLLRHQSELLVGAMTLAERAALRTGSVPLLIMKARPAPLEGGTSSRDAGLYLPANVILETNVGESGREEAGYCGERLAWLRLQAERAAEFDPRDPEKCAMGLPCIECPALFIDHPWDIIRHQPRLLAEDCRTRTPLPGELAARIAPSAVLDESAGKVIVESGAVIEPFAYIVGPAWIGRNAIVKAHAAIRQSIIGEGSRIGGELSHSTIFPHSNKQHDGFLGQSVVGSWVNIGAGATGSNLKNTYGEIRIDGEGTGMNYLGQIVGDHVKIGIQAVLDTGSIYGICSNIFASGAPSPKRIGNFDFAGRPAAVDAIIRTAKIMMARRGMELSASMETLMRAYGSCQDEG